MVCKKFCFFGCVLRSGQTSDESTSGRILLAMLHSQSSVKVQLMRTWVRRPKATKTLVSRNDIIWSEKFLSSNAPARQIEQNMITHFVIYILPNQISCKSNVEAKCEQYFVGYILIKIANQKTASGRI